jgi:hypothetical protein
MALPEQTVMTEQQVRKALRVQQVLKGQPEHKVQQEQMVMTAQQVRKARKV